MQAVLMVRNELTADASLAEIRARSKFGIAMAAIIRIIATTIRSSISEKPFCDLRILYSPMNVLVTRLEPCIAIGDATSIPESGKLFTERTQGQQGRHFQSLAIDI